MARKEFTIIDTGGIEAYSEDFIKQQMIRQAQIAIDTADVIVLMVDLKTGMNAVTKMLRYASKIFKASCRGVNKADRIGDTPPEAYEFYNLGMGEISHIINTWSWYR